MMNNLPEEEKTEDAQLATVDASESDAETDAKKQSIEVTETASDVQLQTNEQDHQVIALLERLFEQSKETNRISQERELIIDRLHQENQKLKQGELQQALLPIFRDLIRLYDDLKSTTSKYSDQATTDNGNVKRDLSCYRETVLDILYRYGVEKIEVSLGADFDSKEHKAVVGTPIAEKEQDRKISGIIRDGFKAESKIIRNVEVEVFRYAAPEHEKEARDIPTTKEETENQPEVQ
jgi:molecular chaperone GrpE (heat shock protein)